MIRAGKDVLDHLGVESVLLTYGDGKKIFCSPSEIGAEEWVCSSDGICPETRAELRVRVRGGYVSAAVSVTAEDADLRVWRLAFLPPGLEAACPALAGGIAELERQLAFQEKRREVRYRIGVRGSALLGLRPGGQSVVFRRRELPCLLNNASFSGGNVTTVEDGAAGFRAGEEIVLRLSFDGPVEQMFLRGRICSVALKTPSAPGASGFRFAVISLELHDPPLSWRNRLARYVRALEPEGSEED